MQLEFHQLDRRWEHLRVRHPARQRRLLASLAEGGQQTPIVVVAAESQVDCYVVIDSYKRIAALEQLGRDTVEAVVWPMGEAAAVLLDRSLRLSEHETALEVGWLLAELERRFGNGLDGLARRFDRSVSWVSRRLALVEVLPEAIQQQVREGKVLAQVALKFLVPAARQDLEDCQRMATIFAQHHCDTREAGQLYAAWRKGSPAIRKRILDDPELFFQVEGPAWIGRDGCDVEAKVPAGASREQIRTMMQTLFAERFHLVVRKEKRPYPCYTMTVAQNGPHLTEINPAEAAIFREDDPTPPPKISPGQSPPIGLISTSHTPEGITMRAKMSAAELANYISNQMERPVVDLTHLAGVYDLRFTYQAHQSAPGPDPGSTLVQSVEQALGLRIEAGKTPLEFIIVDRAGRVPTQN